MATIAPVTTRYKAIDGKVYAYPGKIECGTALTANGNDLERFDRALQKAKAQRETTRTV